jgi:hypothetical protein
MRGNSVRTNLVGSTEPGRARLRTFGSLPYSDGQVTVQVLNGRGNVDVIQQPTRQNGYTTIVRVEDPSAGSANYRIAAYWNGYSNGEVYGNGNYGNGNNRDVYRGRRDRDRDHDEDRDRDRGNGGYNNGGYGTNGNYYPQGANQALHWSGNVDGELEIRIQNGRMSYRTISGQQPTNIRADAGNMNMPRGNANVSVVQNQGRGTVSVIQQPSSWNGYTTVIRIRDPQGGYGYYDFSLLWQ